MISSDNGGDVSKSGYGRKPHTYTAVFIFWGEYVSSSHNSLSGLNLESGCNEVKRARPIAAKKFQRWHDGSEADAYDPVVLSRAKYVGGPNFLTEMHAQLGFMAVKSGRIR